MKRAPPNFRQADVTRAARGVQAAGVEVGRVEIDPTGKIIITSTAATVREAPPKLDEPNEWDGAT